MSFEKFEIVEDKSKDMTLSVEIAEASLWDFDRHYYSCTIALGFLLASVVML